MSFSLKTCDYFFDVGLFSKTNQLKREEFQKLCTRYRTKSFFDCNTNQKTFIICCRTFIKDCFQTLGIEKLAEISRIDCVYCFDENDSVWCSRDIQIDDYCPPCQMKALVEFSKNLHDFNADFCLWF